uniref:hypothetical protein n=1 Tax=Amycolatopsis sp. CA-096443 TaxID=3239919 RepID=UPI003F49183C
MTLSMTAAQLADALERTGHAPHNTGALSMLDEATIAFGAKSAELGEAQRRFADARIAHLHALAPSGGDTDDAWRQAMQAARRLAALLRPLGDARIARCTRPAGWGPCGLPLDEDGECRSAIGHLDTP